MTFVLQLHFVKMNLNLKQQKKNAKKDVLRLDYLLYFSFFLLPLIGLQFHLY